MDHSMFSVLDHLSGSWGLFPGGDDVGGYEQEEQEEKGHLVYYATWSFLGTDSARFGMDPGPEQGVL